MRYNKLKVLTFFSWNEINAAAWKLACNQSENNETNVPWNIQSNHVQFTKKVCLLSCSLAFGLFFSHFAIYKLRWISLFQTNAQINYFKTIINLTIIATQIINATQINPKKILQTNHRKNKQFIVQKNKPSRSQLFHYFKQTSRLQSIVTIIFFFVIKNKSKRKKMSNNKRLQTN